MSLVTEQVKSAPPVIDISGLLHDPDDPRFGDVVHQIDAACREHGFFSIVGHGANMDVLGELERLCREFFALPAAVKDCIAMRHGGSAWRGWFPAGGELTSGVPDRKEGIYFGTEIAPADPRVVAGLPLHGPNLFPDNPDKLRETVLMWLAEMRMVADRLMRAVSVALGFDATFFESNFTADPTVLFRVFTYSPADPDSDGWGVGEHTDYGLLTLLAQDDTGGLQVKTGSGWVDIAPQQGAIVCNLGDMLELMTGGRYRSTPHRVISPRTHDRLSFPYFFDPSFDAVVAPVVSAADMADVNSDRWDGTSPMVFRGTYGQYLTDKVAKVFPELFASLGDDV